MINWDTWKECPCCSQEGYLDFINSNDPCIEVHHFLTCEKDLCGCGEDLIPKLKKDFLALSAHDWDKREHLGDFELKIYASWGLTEHGSSVYGSWLTDDGKKFLEMLTGEQVKEIEYE